MASNEDLDKNIALEKLFDVIGEDIEYRVNFYPTRAERDAEMYLEINGECFKITATHHPHGWL